LNSPALDFFSLLHHCGYPFLQSGDFFAGLFNRIIEILRVKFIGHRAAIIADALCLGINLLKERQSAEFHVFPDSWIGKMDQCLGMALPLKTAPELLKLGVYLCQEYFNRYVFQLVPLTGHEMKTAQKRGDCGKTAGEGSSC
jgi:hypothetical protein